MPATGTYYARVAGYNGAHSPLDPYTLLVTLTAPVCPDTYEPNNSFDQAIRVYSGVVYQSYSCNSDDLDYFKFYAADGQRITIDLYDMEINSELALYDPSQSEVATSRNSGPTPEHIDHTATSTGWHFAMITWNAYEGRPKDRLTFGLFSRISPDGRHVISTVNDYGMAFEGSDGISTFVAIRAIDVHC